MAKAKKPMTAAEMGAKGGRSRAANMTDEERAEAARKAAEGRWLLPVATHAGTFDIGGYTMEAAVLDDGRRVLARQSVLAAMGRKGQPTKAEPVPDGQNFKPPSFLDADNLKPFIGEDLSRTSIPVVYRTGKGGRGYGYEARLLPMACEVYLAARRANVLTHNQMPLASACELLIRGLAQNGIVGLVDEATGYQEVRDKKALQAILDKYLRQEFADWAKRFPDRFYQEMFRLKGWTWKQMNPAGGPRCVASYTNNLVYARLETRLLEELQTRNPVQPNGRRKAAHHQYLTDEVGHPALSDHLKEVIAIMRACPNGDWDGFMRMMDRSLPKTGHSIQLDFDDLGITDEPEKAG